LIQFKQQRDQSAAEWLAINQLLEIAGRTRTNNANFQLNPTDPRDFEANLRLALGGEPNFDGLTEVENIYDLYDQRIRESVQQFIWDRLYFKDINDFVRMMQIKVRIDNEWQEINRLLVAAAQRKRNLTPPYAFPADFDPTDFEANLAATLGPLTYPNLSDAETISNIDRYYDHVLAVEGYFYTSAENFIYLMSVAENPTATPQDWDKVYAILAEAHKGKVYADRRSRLQEIREAQGFEAMISFAVGDESIRSGLTVLERLQEYLSNAEDAAFLVAISQAADTTTTEDWTRT
jgi:hypothetical protein